MKTIPTLLLATALVLLSGCASAVLRDLHNTLPILNAATLSIHANIATVGGGALDMKGFKTDPVTHLTTADEIHESLTTGGGNYNLDATGVTLKTP